MLFEITIFTQIIITRFTMKKITHIYNRFCLAYITSCTSITIRIIWARLKYMIFITFGCDLKFFSICVKNYHIFSLISVIWYLISLFMDTMDPKTFKIWMIAKNIFRIGNCIKLSFTQHTIKFYSVLIVWL